MPKTDRCLPTVQDEIGRYDVVDLRLDLERKFSADGPQIELLDALVQAVKDSNAAAEGMSADLSSFVDYVCEALCKHGGWDEIDGDGSPESIIAERIRNIAERDAPRWWDE